MICIVHTYIMMRRRCGEMHTLTLRALAHGDTTIYLSLLVTRPVLYHTYESTISFDQNFSL